MNMPGHQVHRVRFAVLPTAALLVLTGSGCGKTLVDVTGTLTKDGKPLNLAKASPMMIFYPMVEGRETSGFLADLHRDGRFEIRNPIPPGKYRIALQMFESMKTRKDMLQGAFSRTNSKIVRNITAEPVKQKIKIDLARPEEE